MFTANDLKPSRRVNAPAGENHGYEFLQAMENFARTNKADMRGQRLSKRQRRARNAFAHGDS